MSEVLAREVEEKILNALSTTDVETDQFSSIVDDAVAIGKLEVEHEKMSLEREELDHKMTNENAKLNIDERKMDLEERKADLESEKVEIEVKKLNLEKEKLKLEREKADKENEIEKGKLRNELINKGIDAGVKVLAIGGLVLICAAGVPLKDAGIIPDKLPFYAMASKLVSKYV